MNQKIDPLFSMYLTANEKKFAELMSNPKYYGQWVVISKGELLDADKDYAKLLNKYRDEKGIIITRIYPPSDDVM